MGKRNIPLMCVIFMIGAALLFSGCSGGGGGSSSGSGGVVQSLKVGERVSVVDAQDSQTSNQINALKLASAVADLPAGSPYNTDETHSYVEERSSESFDIINEILCMMAQTGYDEMLNQGNYKAMINMSQCEGSKDNAESAGQASQNQSSGANAEEYEYWTVNSSRADNDSPQIVKVWVHEKEEDHGGGIEPAKTILVKTIITESKSATNPYGIFTLYFQGVLDSNGQEMMTGYLKAERDNTGTVLLKFYESGQHGDGSGSQQVTLNRSTDGSTGSGSLAMTQSWQGQTQSKAFNIAYNNGFFLRQEIENNTPGESVCMNRTNTESSVWRYGVYYDENHDTPGERVSINSGFPIKYTDNNGSNYHGWAGYHGLWIDNNVTIPNGATVYKQDYSSNGGTETAYTMFMARGKLRKHMKKTVTLGDINGVPISWNECTDQGNNNWICTDSRVEWNGTNFVKNAVRNDQTNYVWQEVTAAPITIDPDAWDFHFWSESLGGSGRINLKDPTDPNGVAQITLSDSTPVIFHVEDTVYPGDTVPDTLACFENCPDPSLINTQSEPFFAKSTWQDLNNFSEVNQNTAPGSLAADTNYIEYGFNSTSMELEHNSTPVVMETAPQGVEYGTWSGTMFAPTPENFALLGCDWDQTNSSTCAWQAWDKLDVFYTWESGVDQWNRLTALKDLNDTFVSFDPPINVEYTHTTGAKYFLEYNGFGDLHGVPGKCVDEDTGQDTDCYDSTGDKYIRWVPDFSVSDGSSVTDAVSSLTYYVKGLDKEVRMMAESDASTCTTAGLATTDYALPDASLFVAPDIGTEPDVDGAPAVIAGEVQE